MHSNKMKDKSVGPGNSRCELANSMEALLQRGSHARLRAQTVQVFAGRLRAPMVSLQRQGIDAPPETSTGRTHSHQKPRLAQEKVAWLKRIYIFHQIQKQSACSSTGISLGGCLLWYGIAGGSSCGLVSIHPSLHPLPTALPCSVSGEATLGMAPPS